MLNLSSVVTEMCVRASPVCCVCAESDTASRKSIRLLIGPLTSHLSAQDYIDFSSAVINDPRVCSH